MAVKILTNMVVFSSLLNGVRDTFVADRETLNYQVQESSSKMLNHREPMRNIVLPGYFRSLKFGNKLPLDNYTV